MDTITQFNVHDPVIRRRRADFRRKQSINIPLQLHSSSSEKPASRLFNVTGNLGDSNHDKSAIEKSPILFF